MYTILLGQFFTTNFQCKWGGLIREKNGNASIGWQLSMIEFREGICMKPGKTQLNSYIHPCFLGTNLTLHWRRGYHNVMELKNENDYENCQNVNWNGIGYYAPNNTNFPPSNSSGFQEGVYYIVCPVGSGEHCLKGMKLKINVTDNCEG